MKRDLRFERFLKHPPERVWRALTEREAIAAWYMETDFKAAVGHRFYLKTDPGPGFDGKLYGEVVEVDAPRRLVYTFKGGFMRHDTRVTWTLTAQEGGTLLVLEHTGFTGLVDAAVVSFIIGYGWVKFLKNLPDALNTI